MLSLILLLTRGCSQYRSFKVLCERNLQMIYYKRTLVQGLFPPLKKNLKRLPYLLPFLDLFLLSTLVNFISQVPFTSFIGSEMLLVSKCYWQIAEASLMEY